MENKRIAIVRIKGKVGLKKGIKSTLNMLHLYKKNSCTIIPNTTTYVGMLKKLKDCVTWGELNEETCKLLLEKRGKLPSKKPLTEAYLKTKIKMNLDKFVKEFMSFKKELKDVPGLKQFFKLKPPEKGFERGGTKKPFSLGGVLGYRKEKINDLIKRMI